MTNQDALKLDFIVGKSDEIRKRRACIMCAKAHLGCDGKRPCQRCITRGHPGLCKENEMTKKKVPKNFVDWFWDEYWRRKERKKEGWS